MEFSFRFSLSLIRSSPGELARALKNNLHSLAQNQPPPLSAIAVVVFFFSSSGKSEKRGENSSS